MEISNRPPRDVYAGAGSVTARRSNSPDRVAIVFSGAFNLAELGPIIAWAVGERPSDRTFTRTSTRRNT